MAGVCACEVTSAPGPDRPAAGTGLTYGAVRSLLPQNPAKGFSADCEVTSASVSDWLV